VSCTWWWALAWFLAGGLFVGGLIFWLALRSMAQHPLQW
jgi:hypothetical protein